MSKNPVVWTCPECQEQYMQNMTSDDIVERVARAPRCGTCGHIIWRWGNPPPNQP